MCIQGIKALVKKSGSAFTSWLLERSKTQIWCRGLKVRDVIRLILDEGWYQVAQEGSRRQFKHPRLRGRVTIAGHLSDDLPPRTLRSILKQARLGLMR